MLLKPQNAFHAQISTGKLFPCVVNPPLFSAMKLFLPTEYSRTQTQVSSESARSSTEPTTTSFPSPNFPSSSAGRSYLVKYLVTNSYVSFFTVFLIKFLDNKPNAFFLSLRMGDYGSESVMRWVWEANRATPIRENVTLTFLPDGNLVLTDADGTVIWQTATSHKGVAGLTYFELVT